MKCSHIHTSTARNGYAVNTHTHTTSRYICQQTCCAAAAVEARCCKATKKTAYTNNHLGPPSLMVGHTHTHSHRHNRAPLSQHMRVHTHSHDPLRRLTDDSHAALRAHNKDEGVMMYHSTRPRLIVCVCVRVWLDWTTAGSIRSLRERTHCKL